MARLHRGLPARIGHASGADRRLVLLGDGAEWIWHRAGHFLGVRGTEVGEVVDIYHAYEHLWAVANAVFGAGSVAAAAWTEPLKDRLYEQGATPVLVALAALVPETADAAEAVRVASGYFTTHAARMDYPRFVARRFPIGSGAAESTCKGLIEARAKGAGMRWSQAGVQAVASLRAVPRSGRWDGFWQTQPQRRSPYLRALPRPRPTAPAAPRPPRVPPASAADPSVVSAPAAPPKSVPRARPTPLRHQRPFLPPRVRSA